MKKYIDNYGNEIDADYKIDLPVENIKQDLQAEEIWRRLLLVDSTLEVCKAKILLRQLLTDMESWMEENPKLSPIRWSGAPSIGLEK